jgi:chaperonin cofactor prefoldin
MDWFQSKTTQLIALAGIVSTLAGFGYQGATYINRIENLENKIATLGATEDAQNAIEERFASIETSVNFINKTIDGSIVPDVKDNGEMIQVIEVDLSTMETRIQSLGNQVERLENKDDNPLAN